MKRDADFIANDNQVTKSKESNFPKYTTIE